MKPVQGTYAIILYSSINASIKIGRWGSLTVQPVYYIYTGSAFGPGGIRARVMRHFRNIKTKYWHIDYLIEYVKPVYAWISYEPVKLEHKWAQIILEMNNVFPVKGFGCSDCNCVAHLFATAVKPDYKQFSKIAGGNIFLFTGSAVHD